MHAVHKLLACCRHTRFLQEGHLNFFYDPRICGILRNVQMTVLLAVQPTLDQLLLESHMCDGRLVVDDDKTVDSNINFIIFRPTFETIAYFRMHFVFVVTTSHFLVDTLETQPFNTIDAKWRHV